MTEYRPGGMSRDDSLEVRMASAELAFRQGKISGAEYRAGLALLEARRPASESQETFNGSDKDCERHLELLKLMDGE